MSTSLTLYHVQKRRAGLVSVWKDFSSSGYSHRHEAEEFKKLVEGQPWFRACEFRVIKRTIIEEEV